jgi:hypothetical protein
MKKILLLLLCIPFTTFSQSNQYFDGIDFDSSCIIIGTGPYLQTNVDKFERFEFVIRNKEEFNKIKKLWVFNKRAEPLIQRNLFIINVIKEKKAIGGGVISPSNSNIRFKDGWYYFDTILLQNIGRTNHLKYFVEKREFADSFSFEKYYDSVKTMTSLLYLTNPSFEYEGSFNIILKKSQKIQNASEAISFLKSEFEKIYPECKTQIVMILDDFNSTNYKTAIRLNVSSKKILFEKLNGGDYQIDEWKQSSFVSTIFWEQ